MKLADIKDIVVAGVSIIIILSILYVIARIYYSCKNIKDILKLFEEIEKVQLYLSKNVTQPKVCWLKIIMVMEVGSFLFLLHSLEVIKVEGGVYFSGCISITSIIGYMETYYISKLVYEIHIVLSQVNNNMQFVYDSIVQQTEVRKSTLQTVELIMQAAQMRYKLIKIAREMNRIFNMPIVVTCIWNLALITINTHYYLILTIRHIQADEDYAVYLTLETTFTVIWWVIKYTYLFFMIQPWTSLCVTEKKVATIIHDIWNKYATADKVDENLNHLQLVLLQVLNSELKFTVYGFFPLDWTLIFSNENNPTMVNDNFFTVLNELVKIVLRALRLVFGQRISDGASFSNSIVFLYNWMYILILIVFYIVNCYTIQEKLGYEGYSFISRITFCCTFYLLPVFAIFINTSTNLNYHSILQSYENQKKIIQDLNTIGIRVKSRLIKVAVMVLINFSLSVLFLVWDLSQHSNDFSLVFWFNAYLPGVTIVNYFLNEYTSLETCRLHLCRINEILESFTSDDHWNSLEKRKKALIKLQNHRLRDHCTTFEEIFNLQALLCENIEDTNSYWGYPFLFLIGISFAMWLSTIYSLIMDVLFIVQDKTTMTRTVYACDLWSVMYAIGVLVFLEICEDFSQITQHTVTVLHKLLNIYPELKEEGEMYSLMLTNEKLKLSAAGYFVLERPLLLEVLSTLATYFIVLVQLETQINK
ncbi:hypothetical protein FQA39_LY07262 [Lamprigera yunnana]|nr:hypothetical protein FQA39_LY07262 [Lamprigera yunnana]